MVRIPEGVDVEVERRSGSIGGRITGGRGTFETTSGAIRMTVVEGDGEGFGDDGPHEFRTDSGPVRVDSAAPLVLDVMTDTGDIRIGDETNIQDGAVLHCTYQKAPLTIGSRVSIGHRALVHGCTVEDDVLIGMGAIVMDYAVVGTGCIVAAGAVVLENFVCEPGFLYAGVPAKKIKPVTEAQREGLKRTAANYQTYASWFR